MWYDITMSKNNNKIVIKPSRGRDIRHRDHVSGDRKYMGAGYHSPKKYRRVKKTTREYIDAS